MCKEKKWLELAIVKKRATEKHKNKRVLYRKKNTNTLHLRSFKGIVSTFSHSFAYSSSWFKVRQEKLIRKQHTQKKKESESITLRWLKHFMNELLISWCSVAKKKCLRPFAVICLKGTDMQIYSKYTHVLAIANHLPHQFLSMRQFHCRHWNERRRLCDELFDDYNKIEDAEQWTTEC